MVPAAVAAVVAVVILVIVIVTGSGSGNAPVGTVTTSAPSDATASTAPEADPAASALSGLGPGEVAVYFTASTGSSSTYVAEYGITLESSAGAVFRYLPDTDRLEVIRRYTSASYASRFLFPLTCDGRLFIVDHSRDTLTSDLYEIDAAGDHRGLDPPGRMALREASSASSRYAVVGARVLWRSPRRFETLVGNTGGVLYGQGYGGRVEELQDHRSPANLGELHTVDGVFYRVFYDRDTGLVTATRTDPITGEAGLVMSALELGPIGVENWQFAVDGNGLWLAATLGGDDTGQPITASLYHHPWGPDGSAAAADRVYEVVLADAEDWVSSLDADDGRVLILVSGPSDDSFIIYDYRSGTGTTYALGVDSAYAEILVGR